MSIGESEFCPACGVRWREELNILESITLMRDRGDQYWKDLDDAELIEAASNYGHTKDTPKHFGTDNFIGVEYPRLYDGVSYWRCLACESQWDRWSGRKLLTAEVDLLKAIYAT